MSAKDELFTFAYRNRKYLSIKNHSFQILNGFSKNGSDIWYQVTSGRQGGITKEYLPNASWDVVKKRYGGQMIYSLYNRTHFRYTTTAPKSMCFIAPEGMGAEWLAKRWWLSYVGIEPTDRALELVEEVFWRLSFRRLWEIVDDQPLKGCFIEVGDYWRLEEHVETMQQRLKEDE